MIQLSTRPAPQPQPSAGPGVMAVGSDGTGFLAAFNAAPPDPVAPVTASAGATAPPDDPELQDPASAAAAGPVVLWLGAAMADTPYVRPAAPDTPPRDGIDPSAIPANVRSPQSMGREVVPTEPEVTAAVASASAAVADMGAPIATGPLPTAMPTNTAQSWMMPADQASQVARAAVTDGRVVGPAQAATFVPQRPAMASDGAPAEGSPVAVSGRPQPGPAGNRRAAWSPPRAEPATRAMGHYPIATGTEPGGSPHDARTVAPPAAAAAATQAGAVAAITAPAAGLQTSVSVPALGGEVGQPISGPSDRPVAVNVRPGMTPANPHTTIRERSPLVARTVPQAFPTARVNRPQNPFAGISHAVFPPSTPTAPDKNGNAPPVPVPVAAPPAAAAAPTPAGAVAPDTGSVADQPGPVAAALSVGGDPALAETPALVIDGADLARGVTAPGAASQSPEAAAGSGLPATMAAATRQNDTGQTLPIARNDTPPATVGAKPGFSGPPRPDEGPATALAFSPTPSPAADPPATAGEAVLALAQILATPVAPSALVSALPVTPHSKSLAATLIEHARNGSTESVELSLAPDELGRLRMSLQPEGDVMRVLLSAERPETIDLMRRHADQLAQEFRQAGFSGATLSFGQWGAGGAAHPQAQVQATAPAAPATVANPLPTAPPPGGQAVAGVGGLDLRL